MSIDWTRIIIAGLLACAGVVLYLWGPATSHQVAAVLYQSASENGGAPGGEAPGPDGAGDGAAAGDDEVIDAEYVDVDAEEQN